MALAAALLRRPEAGAVEVLDVELRRPLSFDKGRSREIRTLVSGEEGDWELSSRLRLSDEPLTLHAVARLVTAGEREPPPRLAGPAAIEGVVDADTLYQRAAQLGLDYGPRFRTVRRIELLGRGEARAHLDPSVVGGASDDYLVHPALLDGALQALLALITGSHTDLACVSFLPWRLRRVASHGPRRHPVCIGRHRAVRRIRGCCRRPL